MQLESAPGRGRSFGRTGLGASSRSRERASMTAPGLSPKMQLSSMRSLGAISSRKTSEVESDWCGEVKFMDFPALSPLVVRFRFLQWNCRGLRGSWEELRNLLSRFSPVICCLQETMIGVTPYSSPGYRAFY